MSARPWLVAAVVTLSLLAGCSGAARPRPAWEREAVLRVAADPEVQAAFARGRRSALERPDARGELLRQTLEEQRALLRDPRFAGQLFDHQLDVIGRTRRSPEHRRRLLEENARILRAMVEDPGTRPVVAEAFLALMEEPRLKRALESMVAQAVEAALARGSGGRSSGAPRPSGP